MDVYVGTSGYQYDFWRGSLYPPKCKKDDMLAAYAEHFWTVEVNNTFYRMPKREVVQRWTDATPDDFLFVIKFVFFEHEETAPTNAKAFSDLFSP